MLGGTITTNWWTNLPRTGAGTIKTGSGTLALDNSGFINGGILTAGGGTLSNGTGNLAGGTLSTGSWTSVGSGTIDSNGFNVRISSGTIFTRDRNLLTDGLAGTVLTKTGSGTLTIDPGAGDGSVSVNVLNGTLDFEAGQTLDALVISGDATALSSLNPPAAPAPVPEPASAILLVIGALAVSRSRRRRES